MRLHRWSFRLPGRIRPDIREWSTLGVVLAVASRRNDPQPIGIDRPATLRAQPETLGIGVQLIERIVDRTDQILLVFHRGLLALFAEQMPEIVRLGGVHELP